jgi:hypothetical protein
MSSEQRIYAHYKSMKHHSPLEFVVTSHCGWLHPPCDSYDQWSYYPHSHGYNKTTTSNEVWMRLARTHKKSVREIKDIVTAERKRRNDDRMGTNDSNASDHRSR